MECNNAKTVLKKRENISQEIAKYSPINSVSFCLIGTSEEDYFIAGKNDTVFKFQCLLITFYQNIDTPICSNIINDSYLKR